MWSLPKEEHKASEPTSKGVCWEINPTLASIYEYDATMGTFEMPVPPRKPSLVLRLCYHYSIRNCLSQPASRAW